MKKPSNRKQWYELILKNHRAFIAGTNTQVTTIARIKSPGLAYSIAQNLRQTLYTPEQGFEIIIQ